MATGACGINCDVCRLNVLGMCSTCGSGRSQEAQKKGAAQERIFGALCPILGCAIRNQVEYCLKDCDSFPCDEFKAGPYPFCQGFLKMQARRRSEAPLVKTPSKEVLKVPVEYWEDLEQRDREKICENAGVKHYPPVGLLVPFLNEYILVDSLNRSVCRQGHGQWERIDNPVFELICLVYLLNGGPQHISGEMISVQELKNAHFFTGPHELKVKALLKRYGNDLFGFKKAAEGCGGVALDLADASYQFLAFPKVPLYYLLWAGDDEFDPRLSILFDRSIEYHLAADAIWGLVNLVSDILTEAAR